MNNASLIRKYNVPGPRYTSYPTVPYWDTEAPGEQDWVRSMQQTFALFGDTEGVSLYIHLPYCESLCTYCGCNTRITKNHAVEMPYIHAVLKEWNSIVQHLGEKPLLKELHLGGGTPTFFSPQHLQVLINGILAQSTPMAHTEMSFEAHPANTTRAHLETLHALGFRRLSLGIQDFDPEVQHIIHRHQTVEQVREVTETARALGYSSINYDLIYGLPRQTMEGIARTLREVEQLRPDRIAFYSYAHVPWLKPGQRLFTEADLPDDDAKRALYEAGKRTFEEAGYIEIGMDHFALPDDALCTSFTQRRMHRNFMGYTSGMTHLLIGLGASAISDAWVAFAQNEKNVEHYIRSIEDGRSAHVKGHRLTEEDLLLRTHILNLMCTFETTWYEEEEQCDALYEALSRLTEPEADGLVVLEPYRMRITDKGKAFVRNICMALDARLWRNQPERQLFSKTV
jgi:oxygen-independent coproporphyrinogen III oxidase